MDSQVQTPSDVQVEGQVNLILKDLEEHVGLEDMKALLKKQGTMKIYWGTATTGKPHLGYFVPINKIGDFLKAGMTVTILFADLHGFLDNMKSSWELLKQRTIYYKFIITEMLKVMNVPVEKLQFIQGTDYQLSKEYTLDVYKMSASVTTDMTQKAGAEVVKQAKSPLMSSMLYPILQALDEEYLGVDAQFGGVDQRKIFMFARDHLPKIGYKKRIHLMNPLIPGLGKSGKMSSSEPLSKVDFDDSDETIRSKISQAYSIDGNKTGNGLLAILRYVLFTKIHAEGRKFELTPELSFDTYQAVEDAFVAGTVTSKILKPAIAEELIKLVAPLRAAIQGNGDLMEKAYPKEEVKEGGEDKKPSAPTTPATIGSLDIRVGKILSVEMHPKSTKLFVEQIDVGESKPRTIISGLGEFMKKEDLLNRQVLVLCNLPPKGLLGVTSEGMVLCASRKEGQKLVDVAFVDAPEGAVIGERLEYPGISEQPDPELTQKRLSRVLEKIQTNSEGVAVYKKEGKEHEFTSPSTKKACTSTLKGAPIS